MYSQNGLGLYKKEKKKIKKEKKGSSEILSASQEEIIAHAALTWGLLYSTE